MKTTVSVYDFHRAFEECRPTNFSYEGLTVLFDYFEELEGSSGEEFELDVIAICCDYSEDNAQRIADSYNINLSDCEDDDTRMDAVRSYLEDVTTVVGETSDSFIYQQF
jgi:hypothetical protein